MVLMMGPSPHFSEYHLYGVFLLTWMLYVKEHKRLRTGSRLPLPEGRTLPIRQLCSGPALVTESNLSSLTSPPSFKYLEVEACPLPPGGLCEPNTQILISVLSCPVPVESGVNVCHLLSLSHFPIFWTRMNSYLHKHIALGPGANGCFPEVEPRSEETKGDVSCLDTYPRQPTVTPLQTLPGLRTAPQIQGGRALTTPKSLLSIRTLGHETQTELFSMGSAHSKTLSGSWKR